jgi:hypothetical protein
MATTYSLLHIINHVFLPPKLPEKDDADFAEDLALTEEYKVALGSFTAYLPPGDSSKWESCTKMVSRMLELRNLSGDMIPKNTEAHLQQMTCGGRQDLVKDSFTAAYLIQQISSHSIFAVRMMVSLSAESQRDSRSSPLNSHPPRNLSWRQRAGCDAVSPDRLLRWAMRGSLTPLFARKSPSS